MYGEILFNFPATDVTSRLHINTKHNGAYAGLRHSFVFTTKPQFGIKRTCNTKVRLGRENKGMT